ncbi:hypothetical protein AHiyo8_16400 [Arthrobacter sp. Hiyo8]|nr:hypothetical protein AHiyo8_16400 [Arthrobacter sp. Hiyo8]
MEHGPRDGLYRQLIEALKTQVTVAAVGPVTAQPLVDAGLSPLIPDRYRMGALIRLVTEHLALNHVRRLDTPAGHIELRGRCLRIDGSVVELARLRCSCCARFWEPGARCCPERPFPTFWNCVARSTPWT